MWKCTKGAASGRVMETHVVRRPVKGGPARHPPALRLWRCTKGGAPSTVGRRGRAQIFRRRPNLMGGPGVLRTPGRRPPHRNGGARRLSGYAAKSRSDAPTGGAQASPFPCFRPPYRRPMQKGWGLALPPYSHERTTIIREVVEKKAAKLSRQVSCTATPARPIKRKCSAGGAGGCGDSRGARGAGGPVRPILATCAAGEGAGTPAKCPPPGRSRLATSQNKRRGSTGERRSVPGFRAGGEQGTHEERQRKPHEPGRRASTHPLPGGGGTAPAARRDREEGAGPPRPPAGAEKRGAGPPRPGGASTHPPPGGGGTASAARRGREEGGRPTPTGQWGFNPPAARRWQNRPGRPPGQRRGGRPAATGRCFNPPPTGQGASIHPPPRRGRRNNPRPAYASGAKRSVER